MFDPRQLWGPLLLLAGLAGTASAQPLEFCDQAAANPAVIERFVRFDLKEKVFSRFGREPVAIAHGTAARVSFVLQVEGGEPSALRFTGSPAPHGEGGPPRLCQPVPVEEAPDCDGARSPFYDAWIVNRDQLDPECLEKVDPREFLCIRTLESHAAVLQVVNRQPCTQPLRIGLLLTVKSTRTVRVDGQTYLRQFQTPDPTLILEPPDRARGSG